MTPHLYRRAQEVFASAVTWPVESRAAYLDGACGNDAELRREVESLLGVAIVVTARPPGQPVAAEPWARSIMRLTQNDMPPSGQRAY
jgi:hypothetical protein